MERFEQSVQSVECRLTYKDLIKNEAQEPLPF